MAGYRKLGRTSDQRKALLRNLATNLLYHGKITTTEGKAKEVRKIVELENSHSGCRELVLVKVMAEKKEIQEIIAIADIFRAKVVDVAANSLMIKLTGNQNKLDAFLNLMADFEVLEMVRTGITGLGRGVSTLN